MNINRAYIVGRLGKDPELKAMPNGNKVCNFTVATSRKYKDKEDQMKEVTEWHSVSVFGTTADNCAKYLKKGQLVAVEGRIETRSWDREDGSGKAYKTSIIGNEVQFGPKTNGEGSDSSGVDPAAKVATRNTGGPAAVINPNPANGEIEYPQEDINPDDIPF